MLAFCRITGRRENRGDEKILRMDLHVDGIPEWLSDAGAEDSAETPALTEEEALFMTDGYLSDYDAQNQFSRYKDAAIVRDTIFFKCGSILYFFDMQTERAAPLCGKPECTHTGSTCNAYFWDLCGFCYYNEKLQVDRLAAVFIISV